ncbi:MULTISPECIES: magnesium/cobalt transporter CorA [unclassified Bacillus (in: firmicutes)]|uniref:magnesium/cobalt transporter CorA n=1 Tax=unclassified Bacillus (in: firmicutes) TaxID=185979 RepID=UPI0008F2B763|nr:MULTISPECIES: magnesium/cobalt transporter CorA [unclassified Bacillus (in: firmicutes)]SFA80702.1 magnesium transporter [Bacillus sp. UNCCL13]SFQ70819.1 magnesium transporter [Bacillus sp. cl95]
MIRTIAVTNDLRVINDLPISELANLDLMWYWVDFNVPTEEESLLLKTHFKFHPLAIEDCLHYFQRPKLDYNEGYDFFVLHSLNQNTLTAEEVDIFVGQNFIVTFHLQPSPEMELVRQKLYKDEKILKKGSLYFFYLIMDKIVDGYFPSVYKIEDSLNEMEVTDGKQEGIQGLFEIRNQLLKLRRTILPMRELVYRILNSEKLVVPKNERAYFMHLYDHLLKLSEMVETNREMTSDIRDNYISLTSNRMNSIMKTLTVMTSFFIPLTFIASIYGMNFEYMPELHWRWGYFCVLGVMFVVGSTMLFWLWRKGWFK